MNSIVVLKKLPKYWNRKIPRKINIKSDTEQINLFPECYALIGPFA